MTGAGTERESQPKSDDAAHAPDVGAQIGGGPRSQVQALLANGAREPQPYAAVIRSHPTSRNEIMSLLQQTIGHTVVRAIVEILGGASTADASPAGAEILAGEVRVNAPHGLRVRSGPDQNADNVIGMLDHHATVMPASRAGEWLGIQHQGVPGFINSQFVVSAKTPVPSAAPVQQELHTASAAPPPTPAPTPAQVPTSAPNEGRPPDHAITHAVATEERPLAGSATPNTADHSPATTPYAGAMDSRGGKKLDDTSYMGQYHHLAGGGSLADNPTTAHEGELLNQIRLDHRQIDPVSLRTLQEKAGIKNATGAMTTETLRKLMLDHRSFTVNGLLSGTLLGADLVIVTRGGNGFGPDGNGAALRGNEPVAEGEHKADAMAKVAGFSDYAEMKASFTSLELFGQPLGRGLPFLAERLKLADAYLRQRIPEAAGVTDRKRLAAIAEEKLRWDGTGNGAYADSTADIAKASGGRYGAHFHASGLAIDINPSKNPYVFVLGSMKTNPTGKKVEESIDGVIADHLRYAAQIFGGEEITPHEMMKWSKTLSSEELAAKIDMASHSLNLYLDLCETGSDEKIETAFKNAGYADDKAKALLAEARKFGKKAPGVRRYWQDNLGRDQATGLTTHSTELIVALRDVAGLSWGGTEMSEGSSGDFMHFDCRGTAVGQKLYAFAMHNRGAEPATAAAHHGADPAGPEHASHDHAGAGAPEHH